MNILEAIGCGTNLGLNAYRVDSVVDVILERFPGRLHEYMSNPTGCIIAGREMFAENAEYEKFKRILDEAGVLEV